MQISEEEKKAIDKINRQIVIGKAEKNIGIPVYISDLETILNLIEKRNRQLEEKDKRINKLNTENQRYFDELIIKDKTIDEMADFIDDNLTNCILNTMNIDEPCSKHANREMLCKECIKEYFRKKVKEKCM